MFAPPYSNTPVEQYYKDNQIQNQIEQTNKPYLIDRRDEDVANYILQRYTPNDLRIDPKLFYVQVFEQQFLEQNLINLVKSDINTDPYLESLYVNEYDPNYISQLKKVANSLIIVIRTEINILVSNEQLRDTITHLQKDVSTIILHTKNVIEHIKQKRNLTSKLQLDEIVKKEIYELNLKMGDLQEAYPKFFDIKLNSTFDLLNDSSSNYYPLTSLYDLSTTFNYNKEYVNLLNNLQRYLNQLQIAYNDILRYDNQDINNPRVQQIANNLRDAINESKRYLLENRGSLKNIIKYLFNDHRGFINDLNEDFKTLDEITYDINYSCYLILTLLYFREARINNIDRQLEELKSSLRRITVPLKSEINRNLIVSSELQLNSLINDLENMKKRTKDMRDDTYVKFYQSLLNKQIAKTLEDVRAARDKASILKGTLNFIKELFGLEQNAKQHIDAAERFISQQKDLSLARLGPSPEVYRQLYQDSNNLIMNLNQDKEMLERYAQVNDYREYDYLFNDLDNRIAITLKKLYGIQDRITGQLQNTYSKASAKERDLHKFANSIATLQQELFDFLEVDLRPPGIALNLDNLQALGNKADGIYDAIKQYKSNEPLLNEIKNSKPVYIQDRDFYEVNMEIVTLLLASRKFVRTEIIRDILSSIDVDNRASKYDEFMSSLKNHIQDMQQIMQEYKDFQIHRNVRTIFEDRLYLEENIAALCGVYLTSIKTLKRAKRFLKDYNYNIVLFDFDYFVDFTEMSNIYKYEDVINDMLDQLQDFRVVLKNVFYDYNPIHAEKLYRSLRLSERYLRNMQKQLQFVNLNKDKYSQLKRRVDDYLINNTKIQNKQPDLRAQVVIGFYDIVDDINANYLDIRLIRDNMQMSLEEVYSAGKIIKIEILTDIINDLDYLDRFLAEAKEILQKLNNLERQNFPDVATYDIKLEIDDLIKRSHPEVKDTARNFKNLIDYIYF